MILVTGATGYIGRHLVARLVEQGERPRCLVRDMQRAARILPAAQVEFAQGDTTRATTLAAALQGVDTIVHAAFMTADHKQSYGNHYYETNVQGTANLIKAAQAAGVTRIIEMSGLGTRPDKPGTYMQGRYEAERMLKESDLGWTIIQPSVLFGKGAPFIKGLTDLIRTSPVVPLIGGGKIQFQPIYVEDVVTVVLKVLQEPARTNHKTYTIGGPEYYTFTQIINALLHTMHKSRLKAPAPNALVGIGATVMEAVLPRPPLTKAAMALFTFDNITDLNAVERDFGFTPVAFSRFLVEQGV
ncbi:MAG TPA: NAD(P)H-binding protein [Ktedonobacteraceae bacterium]|nr:NAD(P)H-binding protein [Ktedonobacteraceae bacterium]